MDASSTSGMTGALKFASKVSKKRTQKKLAGDDVGVVVSPPRPEADPRGCVVQVLV